MTYRRGKTWCIEYVDHTGKRCRVSTNARTKAEADTLEAEMLVRVWRIKQGLDEAVLNPRRYTMAQACTWWLEHRAKGTANEKRAGYLFAAHVMTPPLGHLQLEHVTSAKVSALLDAKAQTLKSATVNRIRAHISGVFTSLDEAGLWNGKNPVRRTRLRKTQEAPERTLPAWVVPVLLEHAGGWLLPFAIAAYTGMRKGEIERMQWSDVDLQTRVITIPKTKTGVVRRVAIHPALVAILKAELAAGGRVVRLDDWQHGSRAVQRALGEAGVVLPGIDACFHSLRHTWATRLEECDANMSVVEVMGWGKRSTSVMRSSYLSTPAAKMRAEIDKLTWPAPPEGFAAKTKDKKGTA